MTIKPVSKKRVKDLFMRFESGGGISIILSEERNNEDFLIRDNGSVKTYLTKILSFNLYLVYRCVDFD